MTTKTVTTKTGKTIKIELVRKVQDKSIYNDGQRTTTGREIVEYTNISLYSADGKLLASGKTIDPLWGNNKSEMAARGAVASIGKSAVTQEIVDLVNAAFAELDAENPKTDEYNSIKSNASQAIADHNNWYNSPEQIAYRKLQRNMDNPNSDY